MKKKVVAIIIGVVAFIALTRFFMLFGDNNYTQQKPQITVTQAPLNKDLFSYKGSDGVDALTLLTNKTTVEQKQPGFVISINGRKADDAKREFWAFYVNGKQAQVGAAEYVTKNTDLIEWKIENY